MFDLSRRAFVPGIPALSRRAWATTVAGLVLGARARATGQAPPTLDPEPRRVVPVAAELDHPQGLEVSADGETWWISSVVRAQRRGLLVECEARSGHVRQRREVQVGDCYHPGGLSRAGSDLWMPVAEYRRASRSLIQRRSIASLELTSSFEVLDHIGCLAATGSHVIGANWDARTFYVWDAEGRELDRRPNSTAARYQDMAWVDGHVLAGGLMDAGGVIDALSWPSLALTHRVHVGATDRGVVYTHEGMAVSGELLYLLPEDDPSRVFVFPRPAGL